MLNHRCPIVDALIHGVARVDLECGVYFGSSYDDLSAVPQLGTEAIG